MYVLHAPHIINVKVETPKMHVNTTSAFNVNLLQ